MIDKDKQIMLSVVDPHWRKISGSHNDPYYNLCVEKMIYMDIVFSNGEVHKCQMFPKGYIK